MLHEWVYNNHFVRIQNQCQRLRRGWTGGEDYSYDKYRYLPSPQRFLWLQLSTFYLSQKSPRVTLFRAVISILPRQQISLSPQRLKIQIYSLTRSPLKPLSSGSPADRCVYALVSHRALTGAAHSNNVQHA